MHLIRMKRPKYTFRMTSGFFLPWEISGSLKITSGFMAPAKLMVYWPTWVFHPTTLMKPKEVSAIGLIHSWI